MATANSRWPDVTLATPKPLWMSGVPARVAKVNADDLLAGLNERQLQATTSDGGPLVVLAGAGSGKTRVLTRRIAWRVATGQTDPSRVLALTFTRKAAGELRHRLQSGGMRDHVVAGTFHGIALTQLRQRWTERGITAPTILDRKFRMVAQLLGRRPGVEPLDVLSEMEWAFARLVAPTGYENAAKLSGRTSPLPTGEMGDLMERYQMEKRRRRVVDFDDLLALAIRDLKSDSDYAAAVRWRHRHLYVDEFQDVNPLQFELLQAWRGDSDDVFVVGDPNQAIYGWNGADPDLLSRFSIREPNATVISLDDNYRSTPQILTMANAALAGKSGRLIPHRPDGAVPTLSSYPTDLAEAAGIAQQVKLAHNAGDKWGSQAVLVRTNAQLVPIEQALMDAGVPVRVRGGSGPLGTKEVKDALRSLGRPGVDLRLSLAELDGSLSGESSADSIGIGGSKSFQARQGDSSSAIELSPAEIERRQNLAALSRLVHEYTSLDHNPTGPGLLAWITTVQAGEVGVDGDAVELATFHGAKGLEWQVVHVAGLEKGYMPIGYAKTGAQLAEEQRLFYVAVTRAESQLHLSWASERTFGTKKVKRQPSPYLEMMQSAINHLRRGHRPIDWKAQIVKSRTAIPKRTKRSKNSGSNPVGDPLFDALRTWRSGRAKAASVPAYLVFNDQSLRAMAKRRPTTKGQLAGVSGVGPVKLERYGDAIIQLVKEHQQD